MRTFWHNNSLTIVLLSVFVVAMVGMSISGWQDNNNELTDRKQPTQSYGEYLASGNFIEGVFENWESEFLQMSALVLLTIWLRQKGADDSKPLRGKTDQDTQPRYKLSAVTTWPERWRALGHFFYSHSLSLSLLAIFAVSFLLHAYGGAQVYNDDAVFYGDAERVDMWSYMGTSRFWYESFQNWQSEFLAVATLLLLSIKLRERGSPESKPVGRAYDLRTGS
jgi:hypothetical protein